MTRIGCIVMASGASRRFGSNKLMAELDGKPLIRHVIETAQAAGLDPIVASVDDAFHAPVVSLCQQLGVRLALHTGTLQSDTVRCGMQGADVDAARQGAWSVAGREAVVGSGVSSGRSATFAPCKPEGTSRQL